jgi:hypothetical protein
MDAAELALILEGIDLSAAERLVRWKPKRTKNARQSADSVPKFDPR